MFGCVLELKLSILSFTYLIYFKYKTFFYTICLYIGAATILDIIRRKILSKLG